jgi:Domain of unknown function (DUF1814).
MDNKLEEMMSRYPVSTLLEKENALKEVIQEIILYGLSQTDFFAHAAMYGGTAMRLFLGLDRFSEDLDFILKNEESGFSWDRYSSAIKKVLGSFGLAGEVIVKEKTAETGVSSAFVVEPTKDTILLIYPKDSDAKKIVFNQRTKVKFDVSLTPIRSAKYQTGYLEYPTSFGITLLDEPSLFAGKVCAVLFRDWKSRSKGRDFYDFAFYVRKGTAPNIAYLQEEIMRKDGLTKASTVQEIVCRLQARFSAIDFEQAKKDVVPFISDTSRLEVWSAAYFSQLAEKAFEGSKRR